MADLTPLQVKQNIEANGALSGIIVAGVTGGLPPGTIIANVLAAVPVQLPTLQTATNPQALRQGVILAVMAATGAAAPAGAAIGHQGPESLAQHFVIKILQPDPHDPIEVPMEVEASTGRPYHGHFVFMCEVTGGTGPFRYYWEYRTRAAPGGWGPWRHFWPYDNNGNALGAPAVQWNQLTAFPDQEYSFFKGGYDDQVQNNFHYVVPIVNNMNDPWASLPEGMYMVRVTVRDDHDNRIRQAETIFTVVRKVRGRMQVIITQPQKAEGKDMPEFPIKKEGSTNNPYHDPITFDCEVAGGSGNYLYKWTAEAVDAGSLAAGYNVVSSPIPLNFVSRKTFRRGGSTHPVENPQDPEASLPESLYKIKLEVEDINAPAGMPNATAETWIRVGDVGTPTPRSRSSYLGGPDWLGRPAVRVGGGITGPYSPTAGMGYVKRNAVTGGLERMRYRAQNPMAGIGRGFSTSDDRFGKDKTEFKSDKVRGGTVSKNPAIQAAVNQGKRDLNRWARSLSRPVFAKKQGELAKMTKIWSDNRKQWVDVRKKARKRSGGWASFKGFGKGKGTGDAVLAAVAISKLITSDDERRMISEEVQRTYNAFTKADNDLMNFSHQAQVDMEDEINKIFSTDFVESIAKRAAFKYKVSDKDSVELVKSELMIEKENTVSHLIATGKDRFGGPVGALRSASLSAKTIGSGYFGFLTALRLFIFGPWTITTLFVILQFFFVFTYVGYVPQILYIMPIIAGAFVFLLNFADTMRPLDWLTHFMSGAMIGYSAALLLIALGAHTWTFIGGTNTFAFWIAWLILSFIGVFQFYQTGD